MKLKPHIKERWVAALRSGEYAQGKEVLNDGEGHYCCLGVLCEVLKDDYNLEVVNNGARVAYSGNTTYLPVELRRAIWVDEDGSLMEGGDIILKSRVGEEPLLASDLNDRGTPFSEIADLIEEQL